MEEAEKWKRRLERERAARKESERLLEEKSLELYDANLLLEQRVAAGEDRFTAVFDASMDGIVLLDARGRVVEANRTALKMLGYARENLIGMGVPRIVAENDRMLARNSFREVRRTGYCRYEAKLVRCDGSTFPTEIVGSRAEVGGEVIIQGIIRDITARRKAVKELREARDDAERANRAKSLFLATMSHEIRTPLNGIIGFTDLVLQSELEREQKQSLLMVQRSGDILLNIIDDILDFSRIESGRVDLEEVDFEVTEAIEDVFDIHSQSASGKGVELLYEVEGEVPGTVRGDVARVRQVLMNLVSNALKFTDEGSVVIRVRREGEMMAWEVRDTGVGFSPDKAEVLFDAFVQEDASTTRKYGGTGLGLAICRSILETMGGGISAESVEGEGAVFRFTMPLVEGDGAGEDLDEELFAGRRVLVVDDHETNLIYLRNRLEGWGFEVVTCESGEEGLRWLEEGGFEVALVDMMMPGMDGIEFCERAGAGGPPMVLVTSTRVSGTRENALKAGFEAVLFKPVRQRELMKQLKRLVLGSGEESGEGGTESEGAAEGSEERFILVAEDHPINARLASLMLERLGFQAHVAGTGKEALEFLRQGQRYEMVLMDMRMPVMDGLEAARRIRAGEAGEGVAEIPIVAVTANVLPADREACAEAGMTGYLSKPLRPDAMEELFRSNGLEIIRTP